MPNNFQLAGAQSAKPVHFAPIFTNRFFQGLWTQRNPLRDAGSTRIEEKFYGTRGDAMIAGSNVEISNRLTPVRRPGNSVYNAASFTAVDYFYEFRRFTSNTETIQVMVDTATALYDGTGPSTQTLVFTKSAGAGQTFMQSVGNTLYFGNGVDSKKWIHPFGWVAQTSIATSQYQVGTTVYDTNGNLEYLTSMAVGVISSVVVSINVATITFSGTNFLIAPGMTFTVNVATATFLNTVSLKAATVTPSGSNFIVTAIFAHAPYGPAGDSGTARTTDVGTTATTGNSQPVWNVAVGGSTTDGSSAWINYGSTVFNFGPPAAPTAAPTLTQLVISNAQPVFWQAFASYTSALINPWLVDAAGFIWTGQGVLGTGATYPDFVDPISTSTGSTVSGSTTTLTSAISKKTVQDGRITWTASLWLGSSSTYIAPGPASWEASTAVNIFGALGGDCCVDSNGNLQQANSGSGSTGGSAPVWSTTYGGLTTDGTVGWKNLGPWLSLAFQGWQYGYAYHCIDGSVSTLSPLSATTHGVSNGVVVGGIGSSDPSCDSIWVFRTTDGEATPLMLAQIANPGGGLLWTLNDFYQDSSLDLFVEGPQAESNNPPPVGLINLTYHLGRIFGSVGNVVYWSNGPDTLVGNGNTAWPPLNSATYPSLVTRIVPTAGGALVFTRSDIYELIGQGTTSSPIISVPYASGIGLLSYNALTVNGSLTYLFTADSQLVSIDPSSGLSQVGFPIGDQLEMNNWNPATAYLTWHVSGSQDHALYVGDGTTGWFRMTPTAAPESGLVWSPFATIVGGVKALKSIEVSPGVHRLLLGPTGSGPILKRDLSVYTDNGAAYPATFTIGSIVLAQPGQVAELVFATTDSKAVGSPPTLAVLMDEVSGPFDALTNFTADPPQLPPSQSLFAQRFYFSQTEEPAICRHLQIQINWPTEAFQNEMYSLTMFGSFIQEV